MSPRPSNQPPLPVTMHSALVPFYAALALCGKHKPLGIEEFLSPPTPTHLEVEMASAVSTNEPQRTVRKALVLLPHNLFFSSR